MSMYWGNKKSDDDGRCQMLGKIRELEFAAVELTLYLDNNPDDQEALNDYNAASENLTRIKKEYEQKYGPLSSFGCSTSRSPWQWVEGPWPWESGE